MIKINESPLDRKVRIAVGVTSLISGLVVLTGTLQVVAIVVGIAALVTGIMGFCGLYTLLGINTACPIKK